MDVKKIAELKKSSQSPALEIGSTMVLNDIMELLKTMAQNNEAYKYGQAIVDHIQVVRNITIILTLYVCDVKYTTKI